MRKLAYGEDRTLSWTDRLGSYLSRRALLRYAARERPRHVVEIGCGYDAHLLQSLLPYCDTAVGIDIRTDKTVAEISMVDFVIERELPMLEDDSADFILMHNILEHLWHPQEVLTEAYRALKDGGTLFVNVPSWWGKRFLEHSAFTFGYSAVIEIDDHKMYYSVRDLWPLLVRAGFRPQHIRAGYHKFGLNTYAWAKKASQTESPE